MTSVGDTFIDIIDLIYSYTDRYI
uniref:Uncharacterized protein n=1 Tax=Arundo donax TaxID=35708 RepID=A0A0A9SPT5_ARUDO